MLGVLLVCSFCHLSVFVLYVLSVCPSFYGGFYLVHFYLFGNKCVDYFAHERGISIAIIMPVCLSVRCISH